MTANVIDHGDGMLSDEDMIINMSKFGSHKLKKRWQVVQHGVTAEINMNRAWQEISSLGGQFALDSAGMYV